MRKYVAMKAPYLVTHETIIICKWNMKLKFMATFSWNIILVAPFTAYDKSISNYILFIPAFQNSPTNHFHKIYLLLAQTICEIFDHIFIYLDFSFWGAFFISSLSTRLWLLFFTNVILMAIKIFIRLKIKIFQ